MLSSLLPGGSLPRVLLFIYLGRFGLVYSIFVDYVYQGVVMFFFLFSSYVTFFSSRARLLRMILQGVSALGYLYLALSVGLMSYRANYGSYVLTFFASYG